MVACPFQKGSAVGIVPWKSSAISFSWTAILSSAKDDENVYSEEGTQKNTQAKSLFKCIQLPELAADLYAQSLADVFTNVWQRAPADCLEEKSDCIESNVVFCSNHTTKRIRQIPESSAYALMRRTLAHKSVAVPRKRSASRIQQPTPLSRHSLNFTRVMTCSHYGGETVRPLQEKPYQSSSRSATITLICQPTLTISI